MNKPHSTCLKWKMLKLNFSLNKILERVQEFLKWMEIIRCAKGKLKCIIFEMKITE